MTSVKSAVRNCRNWYKIVRCRTYLNKGHALSSSLLTYLLYHLTSVETDGSAAKQATTSQTSSSTIWSNAVRWIESNGGYVHPQIRYNESLRRVYLGHHNSTTTASLSPSSSASQTNGDSSMTIEAGVTLLRIPDACLVSLHSVEKDEQFGKSLFASCYRHDIRLIKYVTTSIQVHQSLLGLKSSSRVLALPQTHTKRCLALWDPNSKKSFLAQLD